MLSADARARLIAEFTRRTGRRPAGLWSAPGRANLIGEHLDYNGGLVLPVALGLRTAVAAATRDDGRVRCWSLQDPATADVDLAGAGGAPGWTAYAVGTVAALRTAGAPVTGLDLVVDGTVPLGGGLSSSAALACAVALAVDALTGAGLDRLALARAGQRAEHDAVGAPVGPMDQVASLFGQAGRGVLFDTATSELRTVPVPLEETGTALLVVDSGVRHHVATGGYAERRRSCETAARALGVEHLAHLDEKRLGELEDPTVRRRTRHVVTEQQRVRRVVEAFEQRDMAAAGRAFVASHQSQRDDFEVSVPEVDALVDDALGAGASSTSASSAAVHDGSPREGAHLEAWTAP